MSYISFYFHLIKPTDRNHVQATQEIFPLPGLEVF